MDTIDSCYEDAAIQGITVCHSSGDYGSYSHVKDGKVHVSFPASDPWVLTVGGTAISNVDDSDNSYAETVWNHGKHATGGGVSAYFRLPGYQARADIHASDDSVPTGRGVPDVAANADRRSCYLFPFKNDHDDDYTYRQIGGTSAAAPLWAGLIARINASLGANVGFINPALYRLGSSAFNDIDGSVGPKNNKIADRHAPGYSAKPGWDACTGLGSINGTALLAGLEDVFKKKCWIQPFIIRIRKMSSVPFSVPVTFSVKVNGFRPGDFGITNVPSIQSALNPVISITSASGSRQPIGIIKWTLKDLVVEDDSLPPTPQIFTWVYTVEPTSKVILAEQRYDLLATVTTSEGYVVHGRAVIIPVSPYKI